MRSLLAALLFLIATPGCAGSQSTTEAREDPDAVVGEQRAVSRSTAMSEASAMGAPLVETLRIASRRGRDAAGTTPVTQFTTLVTAFEKTGLADTLQGDGPHTLFAPTDEAFSELPTARLEALFQHPKRLRRLLRAHLVQDSYVADELTQRSPVGTMLEGRRLTVEGDGQGVTVEGARVIEADVGVANGTIHVIDTVLLPPSMR